jgi:hypothetical protein
MCAVPAPSTARFVRKALSHGCRMAVATVLGAAALSPLTAQGFTLIQPVIKLYVNPNAGYTTSLVQVRGTLAFAGSCPATAVTFKFTFDSKALWNRTVSACNPKTSLWDTGWSAYTKPPVVPTVGTHTIQVNVYSSSGGLIGTAKVGYAVYKAPASPPTRTSPTSANSPTPDCATGPAVAGCPSPSAAACPAASAGIPPPGSGAFGDYLIAGLMVAVALPIAGMALFGPGPLLAALTRRRRWSALFGLVVLSALTLSCISTVSNNPNITPIATVSPSPTPTC